MKVVMEYNWPCDPFQHWMITQNIRGSGYSGDHEESHCRKCRYAAELNKDFAPLGHTDHPKGCRCGLVAYPNNDIDRDARVTEVVNGKVLIRTL